MSKEYTQICTTCGTVNPLSRGTCLKCRNFLELADDPPNPKPPDPTDEIVSSKKTIPVPSDEHAVKDPSSSSSDLGASGRSPFVTPDPQSSYRKFLRGVVSRINQRRTVVLMIIGTLLIAIILVPLAYYMYSTHPPVPTPTLTVPPTPLVTPHGIGVSLDQDHENIGLSDGSYALDIGNERPGSNHKIQASEVLRKGDVGAAIALWSQAHNEDSNDAETLIYLEDQRVLASGKPYVTIVVGSVLADQPVDYSSRDQLQGAYIGQEEYNKAAQASGDLLLRLLVAKSGNTTINSVKVTNQILEAAHSDKTIVGVLGWTKTTNSLNVLPIFAQAHIPMLSSSALGDDLIGRSPYFFRICPPNKQQEPVLVKYTETKLKFQRLVAVYEDQDPFAQNLIDNFTQQFVADGHDNPPRVTYQRLSTPAQMAEILKKALQMGPEAILLAGSRSTDTGNFLAAIPDSSNVKVLTDASIYPIADAPPGKFGHTSRLVFVSPGFPDEWNIIPSSIKAPSFFNEYKDKFDPYNQHKGVPYGYQRPDASAMQAYDAVLALVKGIRLARTTHQNVISGDDLQQALQQIKGSQAVQGVTGQISFGTDGDPVNKEIVVLQAEEHGLQLRYYQGCFQVGDRDCGGHFVE